MRLDQKYMAACSLKSLGALFGLSNLFLLLNGSCKKIINFLKSLFEGFVITHFWHNQACKGDWEQVVWGPKR